MLYIGTDIIEISRIQRAVEEWGETFLHRIYTPAELELCKLNYPSLAARFAGKEAVYKALGAAGKGTGARSIEILADGNGKPVVKLSGQAADCAGRLGIPHISISLSHSKDYAVATAVGEGK